MYRLCFGHHTGINSGSLQIHSLKGCSNVAFRDELHPLRIMQERVQTRVSKVNVLKMGDHNSFQAF